MANNYTSIKVVADRLLRHPLMAGISFEAILDYTVDFLRIVQCCGFFEEKCTTIDIEEFRGLLPEDFYEMYQVRLVRLSSKIPKYEMSYRTDEKGNFIVDENGNKIPNGFCVQTGYEDVENYHNKTFRYATDSFHMSDMKSSIDLTYKIQGGVIYTSIKEGQIEISYQALVLDSDGYPVIPDNSKFLRALEAYIKKQWFTILFDMGKLQTAIYQNAQQDYAWAVGACESEFQKMTLDKAESFFNSWSTLIRRRREHSRGFATNGMRENLKLV
jgi:hypothetical protein